MISSQCGNYLRCKKIMHNKIIQIYRLHFGKMGFFFVHKIFFGQHESQNIYIFCRAMREIFFQNLTLDNMTKTLNQIIFFSSTKIRTFFSATLGIRIFCFRKKPRGELRCSGRVGSSCSINSTHRVTLVTSPETPQTRMWTLVFCSTYVCLSFIQ